jgi:hypothetical protein
VGEPAPAARADQGLGLKDMPHGGRVAGAVRLHAEEAFGTDDWSEGDSTHGADCARPADRLLECEADRSNGTGCLQSRESSIPNGFADTGRATQSPLAAFFSRCTVCVG